MSALADAGSATAIRPTSPPPDGSAIADEQVREPLVEQSLSEGWRHFKMKVGVSPDDDRRRAQMLRELIGPRRRLMIDANQVWEVDAGDRTRWRDLAALRPVLDRGADEPGRHPRPRPHRPRRGPDRASPPASTSTTGSCSSSSSPPTPSASASPTPAGSPASTRTSSCTCCAARHGVPVCPHAGGVGLCELVQHLSIFDYLAISGSLEGRMAEYVEHRDAAGDACAHETESRRSRMTSPRPVSARRP